MGADQSRFPDTSQQQLTTPVASATIIASADAPQRTSATFNRSDGSFKFLSMNILHSKRALSPGVMMRRSLSTGSATTDEWGFFEDFEPLPPNDHCRSQDECQEEKTMVRALSLPSPVTQPPMYVLESTLATQQLWYATAGKRPKQPPQEREYFEQLWRKNFELSSVQYKESAGEGTAPTAPVTPSSNSSSSGAFSENLGPSSVKADKTMGKLHRKEEVSYKEFNG